LIPPHTSINLLPIGSSSFGAQQEEFFFLTIFLGQGIFMLVSGYFRLPYDIPKPFWRYPMQYISFHYWALQVNSVPHRSREIQYTPDSNLKFNIKLYTSNRANARTI